MLTFLIYLLYGIATILTGISIYIIVNYYLALKKYKGLNDDNAYNVLNSSSSGFNLISKIIITLAKLKIKDKSGASRKLSSIIKKITFAIVPLVIVLITSAYMLFSFALVLSSVNQQLKTVSSALQAIFSKNDDCVCYALCTGNEEDDKKSVYELIFGPTEYEKLTSHMVLNAQEKEEFKSINKGENGKAKSDFIRNHISDTMVSDYKKLVGNNKKFRSGDNKDRTTMSDDALKADLMSLLSDYKQNGRNPQCDCFTTSTVLLKRRCLGVKHWEKGWSWDALWGDDDTFNDGDGTNQGNGYKPGKASGTYTITLDDGTYYWYHQSTEQCNNNVKDSNFGFAGSLIAGNGSLASRGCGIYSSSMALSNLLGEEITPFVFIQDVLGATINGGNGSGSFTSSIENGIAYNSGPVTMNKANLANRINAVYGSKGVHAEKINFDQSTVDSYMKDESKVAYIICSWGNQAGGNTAQFGWYRLTAGHFMVVRKVDSSGNYYCFTSCCALYGGGHAGATTAMNTGISWDVMKRYQKWGDAVVVWRNASDFQTQADNGGGKAPSTGGSWYQYASDANFPAQGTATNVTIGGIPLYNGIPWAATESTYFFNSDQAAQDLNTAIGQWAGTTALFEGGVRNYSAYEARCACANNAASNGVCNLEGVQAAHFAVQPSTAIPTFCDNFTQNQWWQNPEAWSAANWQTNRKYCAVLQDKGNGTIYYFPLHGGDAKGHTFPGGVCQTHIHGMASSSGDGPFNVNLADTYQSAVIQSWGKNEVRDKILTTLSPVDHYSNLLSAYFGNCLEIGGSRTDITSEINSKYKVLGYVAW